MSRIVLATASADLQERVLAATGGAVRVLDPGPLSPDPAHLFGQLGDAPIPDVVVLDAGPAGTDQALALAARFEQQCPAIAVVVVSDQGAQIGLAAMRAGVRDILHPEADTLEVRWVLDRACQAAQTREPGAGQNAAVADSAPSGRVISVVSPKGGVGKTTVATNLAVGLAQGEANSTVLVDLDVQFGDVASALNLDPEYTLPDTVRGPASQDTMVLKTFLTQHSTGLYVICAPDSPAAADSVSAQDVSRLLQMLASEFRYVVVDTAPGLSEHTLTVMDHTSDLVLVTSMDVPGVRGLRKELDTLSALGMSAQARHVVLNFADTRGGLTHADVKATIGTEVDLALPRSKGVVASVNQGIPLLQSGVRDPMTKQLRHLVARFTPTPARATREPKPRRPAPPEPRSGRRAARHRGGRGGRR